MVEHALVHISALAMRPYLSPANLDASMVLVGVSCQVPECASMPCSSTGTSCCSSCNLAVMSACS